MNILKKILDEYPDEGLLKIDGFNDAIIGVSSDIRIVYSLDKVIDILKEDMTEDEAIEFFEFKIECAYIGDKTPIYVKLMN